MKTVYPLQTKFAGGIMKFKTSDAKNDPSLRVYENIKEPPGDGSVFEIFYPWLMES